MTSCNATSANWVVSDNNQSQDNNSSSSSCCSSGSGKWAVRSFSDTESSRSQRPNKRPSASHSDTELTAKTSPVNHNDNKFSEKNRPNQEKINGEEVKAPASAAAADGAKKWNGSLNSRTEKSDTVKELLKMSHSGYSEQSRANYFQILMELY